jgi:hypothetical protein
MATYEELFDLRSNSVMRNKVAVAVVIKAETLLTDVTPSANQVAWAVTALASPISVANDLWGFVLAANSTATVAAITNATDTTIQTNVDTAADAIIAGMV